MTNFNSKFIFGLFFNLLLNKMLKKGKCQIILFHEGTSNKVYTHFDKVSHP